MSRRTERVSGVLREEISRLLIEELQDPRLGRLVTIAHVEPSSDLEHAQVRVTVLGDAAEAADALAGLHAATGYLRRKLGQRLKLKKTPELRFVLDESIREGDHVLDLLDSLKDQETPENG
jgi:ribosome-binding factor A